MSGEIKAMSPLRADPSALGLAAFAVTTFLVSLYNIVGEAEMPLVAFFIFALVYGGLAEFVAGLFEYRREDTFGATVYTTYGAFYLALAAFGVLALLGRVPTAEIPMALAWILLAFAVLNLYFLMWSTRVSLAVFLVFLGVEVTEILLLIGYFMGSTAGGGLVAIGGAVGILTAILAWYAAGAAMINAMVGRHVLPVGSPMWGEMEPMAAPLREQHAGMRA